MDTSLNIVEMCAGYGGIGLGLRSVLGDRLRTIAYAEIETFAIELLLARMEGGQLDAAPIWTDLKTFPYQEFHGIVDILVAGYPCQPFSAAGKRAGKDDPRHLWPWIADGIRLLRPRLCFFENVEGHISLGLSSVISDLEELGYKVSWGIFSASEVGAPHQRKRVFILAYDHATGGHGGEWAKRTFGNICASIAHGVGEARGDVLANTGHEQSPRRHDIEAGQQPAPRRDARGIPAPCCGGQVWPSRPGEPQHGWEPPRVVGNAERILFSVTGGHGTLAGQSGIPEEQGSQLAQADSDAGFARGGEASGMAHSHGSGGEEPRHIDADLPSEPSGSDGKGLADSKGERTNGGQQFCGEKCGSGGTLQSFPDATGEPPRVVTGLENPTSSRSGSESRNALYQGRPSSASGRESISADAQWQVGAAIADDQSASGDGQPPRVVADSNKFRLEKHGLQHASVFVGSGGGQDGKAVGGSPTLDDSAIQRPFIGKHNNGSPKGDGNKSINSSQSGFVGDTDHGRQPSGINAGSSTETIGRGKGDFEQAESGQTESKMGGNAHGPASRLGYAELCVSCDNRTDELRLLGNGVVPATAARAFLTLIEELNQSNFRDPAGGGRCS